MVEFKKDMELNPLGPMTGAEWLTAVQGGENKRGQQVHVVGNITAVNNLASAATTDLVSVSTYVNITGTTTITSFGSASGGTIKWLRFAGALTLIHHATSMILPGAANIVTGAGDTALFVSEGGGNWRCLLYQRASVAPEPGAWTDYVPTVSADTPAGSGFAYTINSARYRKVGRTVHYRFDITIDNLGSGPAASGSPSVALPFQAAFRVVGSGFESAAGHLLRISSPGTSTLTVKKYDNSSPLSAGNRLIGAITYEATS